MTIETYENDIGKTLTEKDKILSLSIFDLHLFSKSLT